MESVLLAALVAAAPVSAPDASPALDRSCFVLMAELAEDEDPRVRSLGQVAAQYFLGRIDVETAGFDAEAELDAGAPQGAERDRLLRRCGDAMQAGGHDFRTIGRGLAPPASPAA
jgi:hypothetical protein